MPEHHKTVLAELLDLVQRDELSLTHAKQAAVRRVGMKSLYSASKDFTRLAERYAKQRYDDQLEHGRGLLGIYLTGERDSTNDLMRTLRKQYQNVHGTTRINLNRDTNETSSGSQYVHRELAKSDEMASVATFEHLHPERLSPHLLQRLLDPDVPYTYKEGTGSKKRYFVPSTALVSNYRSIGAWLVACTYHNFNRATFRTKADQTVKASAHDTLVAMCRTLPFVLRTDARHENGKCVVLYQFNEMRASVHTGPVTARDVDSWYIDVRRFPYAAHATSGAFTDVVTDISRAINQRHRDIR